MDGVDRGFPPGHIRVSDADRDRAVSELSEAFQVGRITAGEFDDRSGQALRARTGQELTALLADLPAAADLTPVSTPAVPEPAYRASAPGAVVGASIAAVCFATVAVAGAIGVGSGPTVQQQESIRALMARQGFPVPPLTPNPGFNWGGVLAPATIAVLLIVVAIVIQHVARARQS